jgi:hypothetical protein
MATERVRGVALELERIAMHLAALTGLATDIAFLQGGATYGRLRTAIINATHAGLRQPLRPRLAAAGRGALRHHAGLAAGPAGHAGAFARDVRPGQRADARRPQRAGALPGGWARSARQAAQDLGLVGLAARASGVAIDTRQQPAGPLYASHPVRC